MRTENGIWVFASKRVGKELLSFLFDIKAPVKHVIAAYDFDADIIRIARTHGVFKGVFCEDLMEDLVSSEKKPEWILNLWSPHILKHKILGCALHRLNLHPSLVPFCRGSDSATWMIRTDSPRGVSIIEMQSSIDSGGVYVQKEVETPLFITGKALHDELQNELISLFKRYWNDIYEHKIGPQPQPREVEGSYFLRQDTIGDRRKDADETMTLKDVVRWILAHDFSPDTQAEMVLSGKIYKFHIDVTTKGDTQENDGL